MTSHSKMKNEYVSCKQNKTKQNKIVTTNFKGLKVKMNIN